MKKLFALEAIDFQDTKFFDELTASVQKVMDMPEPRYPKEMPAFYGSKEMLDILKIVKKHTNISLFYDPEYYLVGPAIQIAKYNKNHIFLFNDDWTDKNEQITDAKTIMKNMNSFALKGNVDLRRNWVDGIFAEHKSLLLLPVLLFYNKLSGWDSAGTHFKTNAREIAAFILHEVGHTFTYFEFLGRTVATNQILSGVTKALATNDVKIIETVLVNAGSLLNMSKEQRDMLNNVKNDKDIAVVLLDASIQKCTSELGHSIYDFTSCEQLADQYATRCGAGKDLVYALSKIDKDDSDELKSYFDLFGIVLISLTTFGVGALMILILSLMSRKSAYEHDDYRTRLCRIREQMLSRLKDRNINVLDKERTLAELEEIDKLIKLPNDELNWAEKIAYYLKPSFRNAHKAELIQRELERLASNNLFVSAAKLSTI